MGILNTLLGQKACQSAAGMIGQGAKELWGAGRMLGGAAGANTAEGFIKAGLSAAPLEKAGLGNMAAGFRGLGNWTIAANEGMNGWMRFGTAAGRMGGVGGTLLAGNAAINGIKGMFGGNNY